MIRFFAIVFLFAALFLVAFELLLLLPLSGEIKLPIYILQSIFIFSLYIKAMDRSGYLRLFLS